MAKVQTLMKPNARKDVEQKELLLIAGENAKWFSYFEDSLTVSHKVKHILS